MSTHSSNGHFDTHFPESLSAHELSIAVIGPEERLRSALVTSLGNFHRGEIREFSSYPPGLDDLPHLLDQNHDIIMIELDSNPEYALDVMEGICASGGSTVMVYSKKSDPERTDPELLMRCMRVGAREFLSLPFPESSLAEALVRAAARRPPARVVKKANGRLLVFCGAKGGAGVTAIACNFAMAVARESGKSTLLIDLDVPLGDTAINLGITPQYSTVDALQNAARLDASFLSRLLTKHASGLSVLAAPGTFSTYQPTNEAIDKLLSVARSEFDNVVVDAGSKLDSTGGAAPFKEASTIYLVTQSGIPELRNANRVISQYLGAEAPKVEIVLNRFESRGSRISEEDMKKALTRAAAWKIPNDYSAVRRMQDTAAPVVATDSSISLQIDQMARSACGLPEAPQKKKGFSLRSLGRSTAPKVPDADGSASLLRLGLIGGADSADTEGTAAESELERPEAVQAEVEERPVVATVDEPGMRIYNGRAYVRDEEGGWRLCEPGTEPAEIPVIDWAPPEAVAYGTPLGKKQLSATASEPGRFLYTPSEGYVLPAGQHTMWVTFVPENASAPAVVNSVVLGVTRARPAIDWARPGAVSYGTALSAAQLNATASIPGSFEYVPAAGEVPSVGIQSLVVRFTPEDKANYEEAQAEVSLTVTKAPTTIQWQAPAGISYGTALGAAHLNATASVPGTLTYTPAEGTILGAGRHTLAVEFTPADATNHTEARAEVAITVAKATPTILWPAPHAVSYGTPLTRGELNATCPIQGSFVYIPGEGAVLGAGRHTPRAIFTPNDAANYNAAQASVPLVVTKAAPVITWKAPEPVEYGTALGDGELSATASVPGTFAYSPAAGSVLGEGQHTLTVTFTPIDSTNFTVVKATVPLTVKAARPIEILWPAPAAISYGTGLGASQLNARTVIAGSFRYQPGEGEVLSAGQHTLRATFCPADMNLPEAQASVELTVAKAIPTIEWLTPRPMPYGTALSAAQLSAKASAPGQITYTPSEGEVPAAGTHTLMALFTPADEANVESACAEVTLTVNKAMPAIIWSAPRPIEYGTPLDGTHLNAECSVPGTFVYAPALGTVLTPGTQTLSVNLVPNDTRNYAIAQASVTILVNELASLDLGEPAGGDVVSDGSSNSLDEALELVGRKSTEYAGHDVQLSDMEADDPRTVYIDLGSSRRAETPMTAYALSEAGSSRGSVGVLDAARRPEIEDEIRTYRGAMYKKGPDGQWHLVQN